MRGAVILTASAGSWPDLAAALAGDGVEVVERPLLSFAPPESWEAVDAAVLALQRYRAVAFTSPRAASAFRARLEEVGAPPPAGAAPVVWASGEATAAALGGALGSVHVPDAAAAGSRGAARALADAMLAAPVASPVLFPCGDLRRDELPERLRAAGLTVAEVVCYRSVLVDTAVARRAVTGAAVVVVASPGVVHLLATALPDARPALVAIGPTTAAAAREVGWKPAAVADQPSTDALAAAVRRALAGR